MHLHINFTADRPISYRDVLDIDAARREAAKFPINQLAYAGLALFLAIVAWALLS